jgi:hypothetical protein
MKMEAFDSTGGGDMVSSDCGGDTEQRFVFHYKDADLLEKKLDEKDQNQDHTPGSKIGLDKADFKDKFRAGGGAKGKTGSTDFTKGKNAFVRPCTVGWKSQNQPLQRGGGGRTPRQKG